MVVPDFILLVFILPDFILVVSGPTLPSFDAPGAGCAGSVWADAIAVVPRNEVMTRAIASFDRMTILLLWIGDAGVKTCDPDLCSPERHMDLPLSDSTRGGRRDAPACNINMSDIVPIDGSRTGQLPHIRRDRGNTCTGSDKLQ